MRSNALGDIVAEEWLRSQELRCEIQLDAFVIMPNHVHGIVIIADAKVPGIVGATGPGTKPGICDRSPLHIGSKQAHGPAKRSLGSFIAGFKSVVTKRINRFRKMPGIPVWQRNYY